MSKSPHPYALYAFHVLESALNKQKPRLTLGSLSNDPVITAPLFVTWNITKHGSKQLRGCIGTFSPLSLDKGIREYAQIAAFQDTRFNPVTRAELPLLSVAITVLMNFEEVDDALDWELGKHGIRVKIVKLDRSYGATFLPDVAVEQGWDKEETIEHCVRKGGFRGVYDLSEVQVVRYEGVKCGCTYEEYAKAVEST